jgi:5-(carboxyamino)imidazole ribonucleotide synthase
VTLATVQDKLAQKQLLAAHGIPVGPFAPSVEPDRTGGFVVKARFGGFDGRGNLVVDTLDPAAVAEAFGDVPVYVEDRLPFDRELAVVVARDRAGRTAAYPVVETVHVHGICDTVTAPAAVDARTRAAAEEVAMATLAVLDGAGVFAIELFVVDDDVLVNEIAPRVHNSGHLTIEACATSQFEQHVRAVTGLPLGATDLRAPAATMVNLLGVSDEPLGRDGLAGALALPETHVHLYGKDQRPARKIGHVTALGSDVAETTARALRARKELGL